MLSLNWDKKKKLWNTTKKRQNTIQMITLHHVLHSKPESQRWTWVKKKKRRDFLEKLKTIILLRHKHKTLIFMLDWQSKPWQQQIKTYHNTIKHNSQTRKIFGLGLLFLNGMTK